MDSRNQTPLPRLASWLAQARPHGVERLQLILLPLEGAPWAVRDWSGVELPPPEASFALAQAVYDLAHVEADAIGSPCRFGIRWLDAAGESRAQTVIRILPTRSGQQPGPAEHPFNFDDEQDASATGVLATSLRHGENMHRQMLVGSSESSKAQRDAMGVVLQSNQQITAVLGMVVEQNRMLFGVTLELARNAGAGGGTGQADDPVKAAHAIGLETAYRALSEHVVPKLPEVAKAVFERTATGKSRGGRNYKKKALPPGTPAAPGVAPIPPDANGKAAH